jgi:aryl-alcohol dehydrogenase-like predicted oxidoreductase
MTVRTIGAIEVSLAGLGCNNFGWRVDEAGAKAVIEAALDAGVTTFDTADNYGDGLSEEFLGRALAGRRDQVVIATKFGGFRSDLGREAGAAPAYVREAAEASLRRLSTDRIDVLQLHSPDVSTPIADTLGALGDLVRAGKVREIGCSNVTAAQLEEAARAAAAIGGPGFASVQNEYSVVAREAEADVLPACEGLGLSLMPSWPLASGLLTGKYRRGRPAPAGARLAAPDAEEDDLRDAPFDAIERLEVFAADRGHTLLELALSWLAARPAVSSVIAGATTPEQVRANTAAVAAWDLSPEDLAEIDRLAPPA